MSKEEVVTISRTKLDILLKRVEELTRKVEELSKSTVIHTTSTTPSRAVLHSLSAIRQRQRQSEIEKEEKVEEMLNKAVDLAIIDYHQHPPRGRR